MAISAPLFLIIAQQFVLYFQEALNKSNPDNIPKPIYLERY